MKKIFIGFLLIVFFFGTTFAIPQERDSQASKLQIYVRNHDNIYGGDRGIKMLSYFRYLIVKYPDNEHMQYVLRNVVQELDGTFLVHIEDDNEQPKVNEITQEESKEKLVGEGNFDEDKIENARISRVNSEIRDPRELVLISNNLKLRETARDRSLSLREKGIADHKRYATSGYYDYAVITKRFADRGAIFENHNGATSTENIGWARYSCNEEDCTQEVIDSLRRIFDYFASEESYNGVHWRTMIHQEFKIVGVSFAIDEKAGKVYGVMHYGTKLK